jgi:lipoprotein-anchoring transpeptidase ErfK/SrfK
MATKIQNSTLAGALMVMCVATGVLIVAVQWRKFSIPKVSIPKIELPNVQFPIAATPSPSVSPEVSPSVPPKPETKKLVVDLSDRQVVLHINDKPQATYSIAVGKEGWETPTGSFKVSRMLKDPTWQHPITGEKIPPGNRNPLGKRWIEFTAQGKLLIGFHGTTDYSLLGEAVSHGCLRMKNADVTAIYDAVAIGTPVIVKH